MPETSNAHRNHNTSNPQPPIRIGSSMSWLSPSSAGSKWLSRGNNQLRGIVDLLPFLFRQLGHDLEMLGDPLPPWKSSERRELVVRKTLYSTNILRYIWRVFILPRYIENVERRRSSNDNNGVSQLSQVGTFMRSGGCAEFLLFYILTTTRSHRGFWRI